jgi:hypothetical protein
MQNAPWQYQQLLYAVPVCRAKRPSKQLYDCIFPLETNQAFGGGGGRVAQQVISTNVKSFVRQPD